MKIDVISPSELTPKQVAVWRDWQSGDRVLASPFFCPEYTQVVGQVRFGVRIAVLESHGEVMGFFPFERTRWNIAKPVGMRLTDFTGVIAPKDLRWDAMELVRGCGLTSWALPAAHEPVQPYHRATYESPYLDLSGEIVPINEPGKSPALPRLAKSRVRRGSCKPKSGRFVSSSTPAAPDVFESLVHGSPSNE